MELRNHYKKFEQTIHLLLEEATTKPISVQTLVTTFSGKGKLFLLIFVSLGFAQIPGIAIGLGFFIVYLGIRISMENSLFGSQNIF